MLACHHRNMVTGQMTPLGEDWWVLLVEAIGWSPGLTKAFGDALTSVCIHTAYSRVILTRDYNLNII